MGSLLYQYHEVHYVLPWDGTLLKFLTLDGGTTCFFSLWLFLDHSDISITDFFSSLWDGASVEVLCPTSASSVPILSSFWSGNNTGCQTNVQNSGTLELFHRGWHLGDQGRRNLFTLCLLSTPHYLWSQCWPLSLLFILLHPHTHTRYLPTSGLSVPPGSPKFS